MIIDELCTWALDNIELILTALIPIVFAAYSCYDQWKNRKLVKFKQVQKLMSTQVWVFSENVLEKYRDTVDDDSEYRYNRCLFSIPDFPIAIELSDEHALYKLTVELPMEEEHSTSSYPKVIRRSHNLPDTRLGYIGNIQAYTEKGVYDEPLYALTSLKEEKENGEKGITMTVALRSYGEFYSLSESMFYYYAYNYMFNGKSKRWFGALFRSVFRRHYSCNTKVWNNHIRTVVRNDTSNQKSNDTKKKLNPAVYDDLLMNKIYRKYNEKYGIFDFGSRCTGIGIVMFTVFKNFVGSSNSYFVVQDRTKNNAELSSSFSVAPAGSYQPIDFSYNVSDPALNDSKLKQTKTPLAHPLFSSMREFLEEIVDIKKYDHLCTAEIIYDACKKTYADVYYVGCGIDPLNLKCEMHALMVVNVRESPILRKINDVTSFANHLESTHEGNHKLVEFNRQNIEMYRTCERTVPTVRELLNHLDDEVMTAIKKRDVSNNLRNFRHIKTEEVDGKWISEFDENYSIPGYEDTKLSNSGQN